MAVPRDGIILAATGRRYNLLARRAGLTVRRVMPDVPIDLFTDDPATAETWDEPFNVVHRLTTHTTRPKMEALRKSRFERSLYIDCDVVAVNDAREVFEIFDSFDIAGSHEMFGNAPIVVENTINVPASFRQINSGVLGIRKSPLTERFLQNWEEKFIERGARFDQPALSELLYHSSLRLAVLPPEYNLMYLPYLRHASRKYMSAPRLLHLPGLHVGDEHVSPSDQAYDLDVVLNDPQLAALVELTKRDISLGAKPSFRHRVGAGLRRAPLLERGFRRLRNLLR